MVSIHETSLNALMKFGATPNVLSLCVANRLLLYFEQSTKAVTVADGSRAVAKEEVANVSVLFDLPNVKMNFIVIENVTLDLAIGLPMLNQIRDVLNFRTNESALMSMASRQSCK